MFCFFIQSKLRCKNFGIDYLEVFSLDTDTNEIIKIYMTYALKIPKSTVNYVLMKLRYETNFNLIR